ncbi:MAG TPA: hypothetical protein VIM42_05990 [Clostridium sp.]
MKEGIKLEAFKRIYILVMDSVGIGESPDSKDFDVNTLAHFADKKNGLKMPNMSTLGLSNIHVLKFRNTAKVFYKN